MALRFVKTSILSSTDGIDFGNEISIDSEEVNIIIDITKFICCIDFYFIFNKYNIHNLLR